MGRSFWNDLLTIHLINKDMIDLILKVIIINYKTRNSVKYQDNYFTINL